jgi:hypothetical protein
MGVSPVPTRSAAGTIDSTNIGFAAAKSRMNFSARGFDMILSRLASHWVVSVWFTGCGMTSLPRYSGLTTSSSVFGASEALMLALLYITP